MHIYMHKAAKGLNFIFPSMSISCLAENIINSKGLQTVSALSAARLMLVVKSIQIVVTHPVIMQEFFVAPTLMEVIALT